MQQATLHFRRHRAGLLIDRNDATGMDGQCVFDLATVAFNCIDDFVIRVHHLKTRSRFHRAKQHHLYIAAQDVLQKRLIHPHRHNRPAGVANERLENLEPGPPGGPQTAALNAAGDRYLLTGLQRRDRLQVAAIFVAEGETIKQVLDSCETHALKIGRAPWTNAFQILKRSL